VVNGAGQVTVTRHRDALEGQELKVLGSLRRHGGVELLVVLPDGSKRMIPAAWTDAAPAGGEDSRGAAATLGAVSDLLAYYCASGDITNGRGVRHLRTGGAAIDAAVADAFLAALQPACPRRNG